MIGTYVIYGAAFISAFLLVEGLYQLVVRPKEERRDLVRRLGGARAPRISIVKRETTALDRLLGPLAPGDAVRRLEYLLLGAGVSWGPGTLLAAMVAGAAALVLALRVVQGSPLPVAVVLGMAGGVLVPLLALHIRRARRFATLLRQLPNALDLMVRGLRAGHPVPVALKAIAQQLPDPVASEFETVCEEMQLGLDLPAAMERLADRVPLQDIRFMAVSVTIQNRTGGNLAEVLSNLSRVIRARDTMHRKARAISAEGRISFWLCMAMPPVFALAVNGMNPGYYGEVWGDPAVVLGLTVAGFLQAVCALWTWRLVNFRV